MNFYQKNKKLFSLLFAVLGLFVLYLLFMNVDDFMQNQNVERKVEAQNVVFSGYKQGRLSWIIKAKYVWSSYSLDHGTVENIYDGSLYDDGKVVLKDLSAKKVMVNAPQERFFADRGVRASLIRKDNDKEELVSVWAEQLQYYSEEKKSYINQKVRIQDDDVLIDANSAKIDHQKNTVTFGRDFKLQTNKAEISGDSLLVHIDSQEFQVNGNVVLNKKGEKTSSENLKQKDTSVTAGSLTMRNISGNMEAFLEKNVQVRQDDKQGFADEAFYQDRTEMVIMSGKAGIIFNKTDWLLDQQTIDKLKNQEARQAIFDKLVMRGDKLAVSLKTKNVEAEGSVFVAVREKEARSEQAFYNAGDKKITMDGNVYLKRSDGSWVQAQQVVIDVNSERFSADGRAESTLMLKR